MTPGQELAKALQDYTARVSAQLEWLLEAEKTGARLPPGWKTYNGGETISWIVDGKAAVILVVPTLEALLYHPEGPVGDRDARHISLREIGLTQASHEIAAHLHYSERVGLAMTGFEQEGSDL